MRIADGCAVTLEYVTRDDSGQEIDNSSNGGPLVYLHGSKDIIPGLERALDGRELGEKFDITVSPEEAYGEHNPSLVAAVPRAQFPADVEVQAGMQFHAEGPGGQPMLVAVTAVEGDEITVDANHPLAGCTLYFEVEVTAVREATEEERAHGHVHGEDGCGH